jgi:hypothetical protein
MVYSKECDSSKQVELNIHLHEFETLENLQTNLAMHLEENQKSTS